MPGGSVNGIMDFLKSLGAARVAAMIAVTVALIGFFAFVMTRVTAPNMVPLFTDLTLTDSSAIVRDLESQGVVYELRQDGSVIMVPSNVVAATRMRLAEAGLPSGGAVGYEIFDKGDSLSATSFLQNVNRLRALEGELARSIRAINRVAAARVHLVIPERPLFRRDAPEPTASIVLRVNGLLGGEQIRAIRHLVASAVPGLQPQGISIVDEAGRLLASGGEEDALGAAGGDERLVAFERRMKEQIEGIVERVVGPGRARAEVRAEIERRRVTQTSDNFDPESRVARSTQVREENSESREQRDGVTVANELPNAEVTGDAAGNKESRTSTEEVSNFEISRVTRTEVHEPGSIRRVSVAVLVDGIYGTGENGAVMYTPRTQEELDRIAALVRTAMGYDQERGDQLEVVNLRFADAPTSGEPLDNGGGIFLGLEKNDLFRIGELVTLGVVSLLVLFLVVRPLVRKILTPEPVPTQLGIEQLQSAPALPSVQQEDLTVPASNAARMVEMAQVTGKIRAQALEQVGQLVERNPAETVAIIRQWLNEPAGAA